MMGAVPLNVNNANGNAEDQMAQACHEAGVKTVFECAGSDVTASLAIKSAPRGAEVMLLGLSEKPASFIPMELTKKGIQINTSIIYDHPSDYERTIRMVQHGVIHPGFIVSRYYSLQKVQQALNEASEGKESKIVIKIH
jgi:L-iditol 2-dehydrogenase